MTLLLLLSRHRRGSRLHRWARKQTQQRKLLRENIKELDSDLKEWRQLCAQRQQLAKAASERGQSWEEQAAAQKLEIDKRGFARHQKCMDYIQKKNLQRGVSPWLRKRALGGLDQPPPETWQAYADAAGVPTSTAALFMRLQYPVYCGTSWAQVTDTQYLPAPVQSVCVVYCVPVQPVQVESIEL